MCYPSKMMCRAFGLAAVLALMACGEERKDCGGRFDLDAGLDDEARAAAYAARDEWNAWARQDIVRFEPGGCRIKIGDPPAGHDGAWMHWSGDIVLHKDAPMRRTILHEIGHPLGLEDIEGPAVMADGDGNTETFTIRDVLEARRVGLTLRPPER